MYLPDCSFWSTYPIFFMEYSNLWTVVFAKPTDCVISSSVIGSLGFWLKASRTPKTLSVNAIKFLSRAAVRFGSVGLRPGAAFARCRGIQSPVEFSMTGKHPGVQQNRWNSEGLPKSQILTTRTEEHRQRSKSHTEQAHQASPQQIHANPKVDGGHVLGRQPSVKSKNGAQQNE